MDLALVRELIRIPTVSRDSNLAFIEYIRELLLRKGWQPVLQYQDDGVKANLVLTVGPAGVPGVIFAGHTDVVPVENQAWSSDPFQPEVRDARLYGRGTCDMKGFIGVVLANLLELDPATLSRPLHLLLTYDEEVGCGGAKALMADVGALIPGRPLYCIVGEPTNMEILDAHKGMRIFKTQVRGTPGHSSIQSGTASAVSVAARLVSYLADLGEEMAGRTALASSAFQYPYTTVNVGVLSGGDAVNIVAPHAEFLWEYRYLPGDSKDEIFARFQSRTAQLLEDYNRDHADRIGIHTEEISAIPALRAVADDSCTMLHDILAPLRHGRGADYCAEAGLYQQGLGCPVILCGPGSITQAHKQDEYVDLSQLDICNTFVQRVIQTCQANSAGAVPALSDKELHPV
ncbi:acetylornithine deacetylase [Massilia sp. erpn]|uniref:acetylornithine deacetylase n=1 Tax=Massilia sp. erpn TaxID=2738142 RepID=UPI00210504FD|nr:acetylornithine deacetylase [Massilia sp. erpn]UTY57078.1 acetylornithine deacetylase [Massilia sp. erpn]